jgi:hypothetical protein
VHTQQESSRKAIHYFLEALKNPSDDIPMLLTVKWLLNIAYMTVGGYPGEVPTEHLLDPSTLESEVDFPRFTNVAPKLGFDTFSWCGGAIVDDFDNDDYLDIAASTSDITGQMRLYRNNRDGTFSERTEQAGLVGLVGGLNMVQADYDNDGDTDILVLRGAWYLTAGRHPNSLLRNNGDGTFTDVTFDVGIGEVHYPTQTASWGDYDLDGDLDLYIGNETSPELRAPCQLFRNNGNSTFTDVAARAGVQNYRYTKGVIWGDFNGDRFPDLYASNGGSANRLYHNNGDGTFTDVAPQLNMTLPTHSFASWFWDFDNDGILDLFSGSYTGRIGILAAYYFNEPAEFEMPCLYRGDGHTGFKDVAKEQGLAYPMLPMGANFGDLNDDGYLDFYLGTGDPDYATLMPNLMYLNQQGKGFVDVTTAGGFGHMQKGHGIAFVDIDHDGDTDVFAQMGGHFKGDAAHDALYENPGFGNHSITIKLVGVQSNRSAIGTHIRVQVTEDGQPRSVYRHINSGGSFGASPLRQTIGLGKADKIESLRIFWPKTGRTQTFRDVAMDQAIKIVEGEDKYTQLKLKKFHLGRP